MEYSYHVLRPFVSTYMQIATSYFPLVHSVAQVYRYSYWSTVLEVRTARYYLLYSRIVDETVALQSSRSGQVLSTIAGKVATPLETDR